MSLLWVYKHRLLDKIQGSEVYEAVSLEIKAKSIKGINRFQPLGLHPKKVWKKPQAIKHNKKLKIIIPIDFLIYPWLIINNYFINLCYKIITYASNIRNIPFK